MAKRHILVSDVHGNYPLLEAVLNHSGFDPAKDELVVLGDWCDIGPDSEKCWREIEYKAGVILLGNHEAAHLYGIKIQPQDPNITYSSLPAEWRGALHRGEIKIAHRIGDVLLTHAGLCQALYKLMYGKKEPSLEQIVDDLNDPERLHYFANMDISPLWVRPFSHDMGYLPYPVKQVAGHTPMAYYDGNTPRKMEQVNFMLIDPYVRKHFDNKGYCLYAVVTEHDDGTTTVEKVMNKGE